MCYTDREDNYLADLEKLGRISFFLGGTKMKKSDNSCVNIIDINLFSERCTVPVHKLLY